MEAHIRNLNGKFSSLMQEHNKYLTCKVHCCLYNYHNTAPCFRNLNGQ